MAAESTPTGPVIAGSTNAEPNADTDTGSSPNMKRAMSKSWIVMSLNSPPERIM